MRAVQRQATQALPGEAPEALLLFALPHQPSLFPGKGTPVSTPWDVVEKVLYLRRSYHFGPSKIRMYLARYHGLHLSQATIWRFLQRAGMSRLPSNMRYQR